MTKKKITLEHRDGNASTICWFRKNEFNPSGQFYTFIKISAGASAANLESAANPSSPAFSSINMNGYESQSHNHIIKFKP